MRVPRSRKSARLLGGHPAVGVTPGVADVICLGLDDAAARRAFGQYPHEQFADEKTSELGGIDGQLCPVQPSGRTIAAQISSIRSTHCAREGPGSNGSAKYWVSRAALPSWNSMMLTE
jgi:hypothetical protein